MATQSPILMALPDADPWQVEHFGLRPTTLEETSHFRLYREFTRDPHARPGRNHDRLNVA
ncbi:MULTISPECIES: hypothetical protein [unclassified Sphingomonas]|uniref:hypothetical protein n=1 Tax=unclassified Sphingomonas TaxID=196159 RepID=UPI000AA73DBE|nr:MULTISPECIES: hypothetical protein [unclassified Sphingomonas]